MKRKSVFTGLTALVISAMLAVTPAVSHLAYADVGVVTESTIKEETEETEASKEQETETPKEQDSKDTDGQTSDDTEKQDSENGKEQNANGDEDQDSEDGDAQNLEDGEVQDSENEDEQDSDKKKSEDAAEEFKANIAKLKAYEEKLESLTSEDAAAIQELLEAVSDYLDADEDELTSEVESFLSTFTEKFYEASIETIKEATPTDATPTDATKSINEQINEGEEKTKTIKVTADTTEDVVIPNGYDITLEIADGVTLTNVSDHTVTVQDGGTLTIEGEGTIDNVTHQKAALDVEDGGVATINGGIFARSKENGISKTEHGGNTFYIIRNHGKLTINDATVKSDGHYSSLIANGYQSNTKTENRPTLTINGGTFNGGIDTIKNDQYGILYITNGDFDNMTQYAVMNWNKAEISGGTFANIVWNGWYDNGNDDSLGLMTITGGIFKAEVCNANWKNVIKKGGTMTIKGGTFEKEIRSQKVTELTVENLDGTPTISVYKDVAATGSDATKLSITAKPEKKSDGEYNYTFLGWFDQNGDAPGKYGTLKEEETEYTYTPTYLSSKIEKDSSADTAESEETTIETLDDSAKAVINKILDESSEGGDSEVEYEAIEGTTEDLKEKLKAAVAAGSTIETKIELNSAEGVSEEVFEEFSKAAENKTASDSAAKNSWKIDLNSFVNIDINMYAVKAEETTALARLTKLNKSIELSITIPKTQRWRNNEYAVARYHDGEVEILDAAKSSDGKSVIFESNLFSYYALVYKKADNSSSSSSDSNGGSSSITTNNGTWMMDNVGWWFKKSDGSYPKDAWYECIWNGTSNWYHFNSNGYADGGWLTDKDGQKYYLHDLHDGKYGYMYTGWNQINGQWYYFNTQKLDNASTGSLVVNGKTADGYNVDANGAWIH